jgi:nitrogen fixation-related uncharacterized protein
MELLIFILSVFIVCIAISILIWAHHKKPVDRNGKGIE